MSLQNNKVDDEISARLVVTGFACDPDHITHIPGIRPHEVWGIGDDLSFTSPRKRIDNGWVIASKAGNSIDLDAHVSSILHMIGDAKSGLDHGAGHITLRQPRGRAMRADKG